jgi:hypothetical protein
MISDKENDMMRNKNNTNIWLADDAILNIRLLELSDGRYCLTFTATEADDWHGSIETSFWVSAEQAEKIRVDVSKIKVHHLV